MSEFNEPWNADDEGVLLDKDGKWLAWSYIGAGESQRPTKEDLKRIAACVNACHGIPTEELIKLPPEVTLRGTKFLLMYGKVQ